MKITLLCNAGLALTCEGETLLIDAPNGEMEPFFAIKEDLWQKITGNRSPFENVCGLYFTHDHPDHYDRKKVEEYLTRCPETPVFLPAENMEQGSVTMGPFKISYQQLDHAPMEEKTPPHVVTWIQAGTQSVYIAADAKLDTESHRAFLGEKKADIAFWNSMYLSQPQTRQLLRDAAVRNYIYHMPENDPDGYGLWRKCDRNLQRYGDELKTVTVVRCYPYEID